MPSISVTLAMLADRSVASSDAYDHDLEPPATNRRLAATIRRAACSSEPSACRRSRVVARFAVSWATTCCSRAVAVERRCRRAP
ncbi:hypothetical protein BJF90_29690 [Pseudonocardia sp. CNS-004]|nr:hypothetical protein BJF90_29690 [Pseudonocardia sp. CNS-004]